MGSKRGDEHKKPCSLGEGTGPKGSDDSEAPQRATASRLVPTHRSIPHAELMRSLARRIVDRRVLHLIKMWLECSVEETDDRGRKTRTTEAKDNRRGIPQGSPISPLLSNLYLDEVDRMLERAKETTRC